MVATTPPTRLLDYDEERERFDWTTARNRLQGLPGDRGLNIAYEAIDRHVAAGRGDTVAIRWLPRQGEQVDLTYEEHAGFGHSWDYWDQQIQRVLDWLPLASD